MANNGATRIRPLIGVLTAKSLSVRVPRVKHSTEWARFDMYLQRLYEVTAIHEIFHLFGAVESCAPNNGRGAHVVDHDLDVMSNSPVPQWEWTYIDFGRDDYCGHGRSDCVDISTSPYFEPAF